jgi:hypothetical protein
MSDSALPIVLMLCVGVLVCLLFPPLGSALGDGARFVLADVSYALLAALIIVLVVLECLFLFVLRQVLDLRRAGPRRLGSGNAVALVMFGCACIGGLSFAITLIWAIGKPVGPYW